MKWLPVLCGGLLLWACKPSTPAVSCPDPALVAPASIGGASAVTSLTSSLAGSDRENAIDEAATRFRRQDPGISTDAIVDVIIAADCPNLAHGGVADAQAERVRISAVRSRVIAILGR